MTKCSAVTAPDSGTVADNTLVTSARRVGSINAALINSAPSRVASMAFRSARQAVGKSSYREVRKSAKSVRAVASISACLFLKCQ